MYVYKIEETVNMFLITALKGSLTIPTPLEIFIVSFHSILSSIAAFKMELSEHIDIKKA